MNYYVFRWSRKEEQKHGWEGFRRRGSHSPQREVSMDGVERVVRDRSKQDTQGEDNARERMNSQEFDRRRNAGGRERNWENWNRGGRAPWPDESDEAADRQRLLESLIDPQDVPRSGEYYEVK